MPKKIDSAARERAVRLVLDHHQEYPSKTAAIKAVAHQVGIGHETLRKLVRQAEVDSGQRQGLTSEEHEQIKKLRAENRRLREDVAILKAATSFFAGRARAPATDDRLLHRRHESPRVCSRVGLPGFA